MKALFVSIVVVSLILLGAHFLRYGNVFGLAASLVLIGLLFVRSPWAARIIQLGLVLGAIEWGHTLYELVQVRMAQGAPVARMVAIIGTVIVVTLVGTRPAGGAATVTQTGLVHVRASVVDRRRIELPESTVAPHVIRLRIDSPRAAAWADALGAVDGVTVDQSATTSATVVATFDKDATVSVRMVIVEISVDGYAADRHIHPQPTGVADVQLNTRDG